MPEGIDGTSQEAGKLAAIAHQKHGLTKGAVQDILNMSLEREQGRLTKAKEGLEATSKAKRRLCATSGETNTTPTFRAQSKRPMRFRWTSQTPMSAATPRFSKSCRKRLLMQQDKMLGGGDGTMKTNVEADRRDQGKGDAYQGKSRAGCTGSSSEAIPQNPDDCLA